MHSPLNTWVPPHPEWRLWYSWCRPLNWPHIQDLSPQSVQKAPQRSGNLWPTGEQMISVCPPAWLWKRPRNAYEWCTVYCVNRSTVKGSKSKLLLPAETLSGLLTMLMNLAWPSLCAGNFGRDFWKRKGIVWANCLSQDEGKSAGVCLWVLFSHRSVSGPERQRRRLERRETSPQSSSLTGCGNTHRQMKRSFVLLDRQKAKMYLLMEAMAFLSLNLVINSDFERLISSCWLFLFW